ncbi:hypothetical protein OF83DRAFT_1051705 [Amylostereum chailletii]|nr:hypothetical protein OF83DRAFT_1051705 [Amylostereum chailletii]
MDGKAVVVKFSRTYGADAHRLLADENLAPKLHFTAKIHGGLTMVVMDLVVDQNAYSRFNPRQIPVDSPVLEDVKRALDLLHASGMVFGDLRLLNVMVINSDQNIEDGHSVDRDKLRGLLIDFDWAGKAGEAMYPSDLNPDDVDWAEGVEPGTLITKEHDVKMFERL